MEELSLAQYVMINWTYGAGLHSMRRGNRSVIFVQFTFQRTLGFYFLQIYIPLTIIVMSSWVSFWLVKTNQVSQRYQPSHPSSISILFTFILGPGDSRQDRSGRHKCTGRGHHRVWREDQAPGRLRHCPGRVHHHLLCPRIFRVSRVCLAQLPGCLHQKIQGEGRSKGKT